MPFFEFDVVQPPNAGELEAELRSLSQLGPAVLRLVVARVPDELSSRRHGPNTEATYMFSIDSRSHGGTPFTIGHLDTDPSVTGRLEVVEDNPDDSKRSLRLTLFDPSY